MIWFLPWLDMWWEHLHVSKEICILFGRGSHFYYVVQFSSVAQSCPTLCVPMDCSTPGLPVHHQLTELAQIHNPWVSDAIQPSLPVIPFSCLPSIRVFSNELALHIKWPKCWSFSFSISPSNEYLGLISFRTDWFIFLYEESNMYSMTCKFSEQPRR